MYYIKEYYDCFEILNREIKALLQSNYLSGVYDESYDGWSANVNEDAEIIYY